MSGVRLKTAKVDNGADTDDLKEVIEYLYQEFCLDKNGR
jgi:hypothetical protein